MSSIPVFDKQPNDTLDYDADLSAWLPSTDNILSVAKTADTGITLGATVINATTKTVKQWVSGGTSGNKYKVTLTITTNEGRIKEVEFYVKVKEL